MAAKEVARQRRYAVQLAVGEGGAEAEDGGGEEGSGEGRREVKKFEEN